VLRFTGVAEVCLERNVDGAPTPIIPKACDILRSHGFLFGCFFGFVLCVPLENLSHCEKTNTLCPNFVAEDRHT
jgi:hypothetical protein